MEKRKCPHCGAEGYMIPKGIAQKIGTPMGGVLGLITRYLGTAAGGPVGTLAAFLAGAVTGQKLGQLLDDHVIRSYRCAKCGYEVIL